MAAKALVVYFFGGGPGGVEALGDVDADRVRFAGSVTVSQVRLLPLCISASLLCGLFARSFATFRDKSRRLTGDVGHLEGGPANRFHRPPGAPYFIRTRNLDCFEWTGNRLQMATGQMQVGSGIADLGMAEQYLMVRRSALLMGHTRSFWDFYRGMGLCVSVFLTVESVAFWLLGSLAKLDAARLRPILATFTVGYLALSVNSYTYFFLGPVITEILIAACLLFSIFTAKTQAVSLAGQPD
jgi:hypothetical protein